MNPGTTKKALVAALLCASLPAGAADAELEARLAALEAELAALRTQLTRGEARIEETTVRVEELSMARPEQPTAQGTPIGPLQGVRVGDTVLKFGGFVDMDSHFTSLSDGAIASNSIARDFYIPGATPVGGSSTTEVDITSEATRIFFAADRLAGNENLRAYIETDFLGSLQGNQRVSNSVALRLRHAYLDYGNWRFGQAWTTFQNTSSIPESASFLVLSDGMAFVRQSLIRYTKGPWQFALENGDTTVTALNGGRIDADSNQIPDLVARYNAKGEFGNVSVAAIGRQLRIEQGSMDEDAIGWGLSVSGRLKLGERDDLRFNTFGGEGLGRYVGLNAVNGAALDPADMELDTIGSWGGLLSWRHPFTNSVRSSVGWSALFADNPSFVPGTSTESVQSAHAALLWDVAPRTTLGTEAIFGRRELENGDSGNITRLTFSAIMKF